MKHPISIYEDVIPKEQFDVPKISFKTKNKCKCGIKIPDGQGACYGCWRRKDRKENPKNYRRDLMFPTNGRTPSTQGVKNHTSYFFKNSGKDFTVDDLPSSQLPIKKQEDFETYDAWLKDFMEGM